MHVPSGRDVAPSNGQSDCQGNPHCSWRSCATYSRTTDRDCQPQEVFQMLRSKDWSACRASESPLSRSRRRWRCWRCIRSQRALTPASSIGSNRHERQVGGGSPFSTTCAACHTLKAAGAVGNIGPNLDKTAKATLTGGRRSSRPSRTAARVGDDEGRSIAKYTTQMVAYKGTLLDGPTDQRTSPRFVYTVDSQVVRPASASGRPSSVPVGKPEAGGASRPLPVQEVPGAPLTVPAPPQTSFRFTGGPTSRP